MNHDQRHAAACTQGLDHYIDPQTGYRVFTAGALNRRGNCCGCSCRHCPYGHDQVPEDQRKKLTQDPWLERREAGATLSQKLLDELALYRVDKSEL